ncbi:MAG: rod shape-determining protein MreD [Clostridiaceae bacterium]|nr:rod shape-determining protein MreD [Clostridiaceae bacterium]
MRWIRLITLYIFWFVLVVFLQLVWSNAWVWRLAAPQFLLMFAIVCGYLFGFGEGSVVALAAGMIVDLAFGRNLGVGMLLYFWLAALAAVMGGQRRRRSLWYLLMVAVIAFVGHELGVTVLTVVIIRIGGGGLEIPAISVWLTDSVLPGLAINVPLAALLYFALRYAGPYSALELTRRELAADEKLQGEKIKDS